MLAKKVKMKKKNQNEFLGMLLEALVAGLLGNLLLGK